MREPSDYWTEVFDRLRAVGADPALMGGLAVNAYRRDPRLTVDAEVAGSPGRSVTAGRVRRFARL